MSSKKVTVVGEALAKVVTVALRTKSGLDAINNALQVGGLSLILRKTLQDLYNAASTQSKKAATPYTWMKWCNVHGMAPSSAHNGERILRWCAHMGVVANLPKDFDPYSKTDKGRENIFHGGGIPTVREHDDGTVDTPLRIKANATIPVEEPVLGEDGKPAIDDNGNPITQTVVHAFPGTWSYQKTLSEANAWWNAYHATSTDADADPTPKERAEQKREIILKSTESAISALVAIRAAYDSLTDEDRSYVAFNPVFGDAVRTILQALGDRFGQKGTNMDIRVRPILANPAALAEAEEKGADWLNPVLYSETDEEEEANVA